MKLYEKLADEIEGQIARGELEPGEARHLGAARERALQDEHHDGRAGVPRVKESWADRKPAAIRLLREPRRAQRCAPRDGRGAGARLAHRFGHGRIGAPCGGRRGVDAAHREVRGFAHGGVPSSLRGRARRTTIDPQLIASAAACDPFARAIRLSEAQTPGSDN